MIKVYAIEIPKCVVAVAVPPVGGSWGWNVRRERFTQGPRY